LLLNLEVELIGINEDLVHIMQVSSANNLGIEHNPFGKSLI